MTPLPLQTETLSQPPHVAQLETVRRELLQLQSCLNSQIEQHLERVKQVLGTLPAPATPAAPVSQAPSAPLPLKKVHSSTSVTLTAAQPEAIDPDLEEATLAELNTALASAFSEIAARGGMLIKP
jgi:hypothetical protein